MVSLHEMSVGATITSRMQWECMLVFMPDFRAKVNTCFHVGPRDSVKREPGMTERRAAEHEAGD